MRRTADDQMTAVDRLLVALNAHVEAFAICEVRRGWRLALEPMDAPLLHYVLAGSGRLRLAGGSAVAFTRYSLILVPPRRAQSLEAPDGALQEVRGLARCETLADGLLRMRAGDEDGGTADVVTACGTVRATFGGTIGLFDHLSEPVVEDLAGGGAEPLRAAVETMLAELAAPKVGSRAVAEALLKQGLVLLLRRLLERGGARVPWLTAATDPRLARPVAGMLERPAEPVTLEELAERAGLSRSAFSERFAAAFGQSPMAFLKEVRLRRAAHLLATTDLPIKAVARSVGYASRSYFSRAFRSLYGADPTAFRARRSGGRRASG